MKELLWMTPTLIWILCAAALPALAGEEGGFERSAPLPITEIYNGQNLMTIYVAGDLSVQIQYKNQTDWQVNPPSQQLADSGFFVSFGGNTYGPAFGSHGGTSVPAPYPTPWTFVNQSGRLGSGTVDDPWWVWTNVSAGSALSLQQQVTYVDGQKYTDIKWKITNNSGAPLDCRFTHAAAMYMQGDGSAFGYYDPSSVAVGGYNAAGNFYESLIQRSPSVSAYEVNDYGTIWNHIIGTGIGLQNYVNPQYIPLAMGLQWDLTLPTGETDIKDEWKMGENPPYPPTPTPAPTPLLSTTLNSTTLAAGDRFTVDVTVQPVGLSFDAYAVIVGGGKTYSMVSKPGQQLRRGVYPYVARVKRLTSAFSGRLLSIQIPSGLTGSYQVIVGLVPTGKKPSVRNVIPGYLSQTPVTVQ